MSLEFGLSKEYLSSIIQSVSFDHDGTIADSRQLVTDQFNLEFGTKHEAHEMRSWNVVYEWGVDIGMSSNEAMETNNRLWYSPDILFKAKPVKAAIEFLEKAYQLKSDIVIASSRTPNLLESTVEWYRKYAPFIKPEKVIVGLPDMHDGAVSKAVMVQLLKRKMHVEDVPAHAKLILQHSTSTRVFLLSNDNSLDTYKYPQLTRIGGKNSTYMPDFEPLNNLFFG